MGRKKKKSFMTQKPVERQESASQPQLDELRKSLPIVVSVWKNYHKWICGHLRTQKLRLYNYFHQELEDRSVVECQSKTSISYRGCVVVVPKP